MPEVIDLLLRPFDPHVDSYIQFMTGERKIMEVRKHWASSVWSAFWLLAGEAVFIWSMTLDHWWSFWPVWVVGMVMLCQACWHVLSEYRDRFVITNQRVMRVRGVLGSNRGMIPLGRLIDITVKKTWLGKLFNYGHFIFESAGQVQALTRIRYVKDIDHREDILRMAIMGDNPDQIMQFENGDGT